MFKPDFSALGGGGSVHKRPALVSAQHGGKAITGAATQVIEVTSVINLEGLRAQEWREFVYD